MAEQELLGKLDGLMTGINTSLQKIDKSLYGNGQPGAMERITRIEENLERISEENEKCNKSQSESIDKLTSNVNDLVKVVNDHVNEKSQHKFINMTMNKKAAVFLIGGFAVLHIISTEVPVLWNLLLKFLGF